MLQIILLLSFAVGLAMTQTTCGAPPATNTFSQIVMRYTPSMPMQTAPTSTIYDTIVTSWFEALDCRYVTPLRVDENPAAEGPFTTYVRSATLVVTRVGCMSETTAVTRRDIRGENQFELRAEKIPQEHKIHKRRTAEQAINEVINANVATFPPDINSLTVQAYRYLVSVNTAIFAINLVESGVDLNQTCASLKDATSQARLFRTTTIDPVQAADIVCFAANNGLYFTVPVSEVVTYLESLIYAVQATGSSSNSTEFCWPLLTQNSPFLGVDTDGISHYLCPSGDIPLNPASTGTNTPTQPAGTAAQGTGRPTGPPTGGPYANSSSPSIPGYNPNAGTTVMGTGSTAVPWANLTDTGSFTSSATNAMSTGSTYGTGISFANVTYTGTGTGAMLGTGRIGPASTAISPDIESVTSSSPTHRFHRW